MSKPPLSYLFVAEFSDGTFIEQTLEDQSKLDPKKSAFYDVLQKKGLIRFSLVGLDTPNTYTVDLRDGQFEVNGIPFVAHSQFLVPEKLRIIYFREVRYDQFSDGTSKHYVNRYFIGWQMNDKKGKNIQQTIAIS